MVRICASRGLYSGPLLALAPVPKLIIDRLLDSEGRRLAAYCSGMSRDAARRALIVHGDEDATVPVQDSQSLAATTGVALQVIPGGDHSLNSALVNSDDGKGMNDRLRQLVVEMALRHSNCAVVQADLVATQAVFGIRIHRDAGVCAS